MKAFLLCIFSLMLTCSVVMAQTDGDSGKAAKTPVSNEKLTKAGLTFTELYPNPSTGVFTMDYAMGTNVREAKVTFFNVLGSVVAEDQLPRHERTAEINLTRLNPGVYFYTLSVDGTTQFTKRVVIKR